MRDCDPECTHYIQAHNIPCRTQSTVASVISADEFPVLSTTGFHSDQPTSTPTNLHQTERCKFTFANVGGKARKIVGDGQVARASFLTIDSGSSRGMGSRLHAPISASGEISVECAQVSTVRDEPVGVFSGAARSVARRDISSCGQHFNDSQLISSGLAPLEESCDVFACSAIFTHTQRLWGFDTRA